MRSGCGVAGTEQILGPLHVLRHTELYLQVARPVMAESGHVPGEARNEVNVLRVGPQVDERLAALRSAETGEVPQTLIRPVLLALNTAYALPPPEGRLVDRARQPLIGATPPSDAAREPAC